MSIVDRVLPGGQPSVAGIIKPIALQFVAQVSKVDESVCPLVGKGGPRTAKNEGFTLVASLECFHCVIGIRSRGEVRIGGACCQNIEKNMLAVSGPPAEHPFVIDSMGDLLREIFRITGQIGMLGYRVGEPFPIHFSVELVGQFFDLASKIFCCGQGSQEHGPSGSIAELDVVGILPSSFAGIGVDEVVPEPIDPLEIFERLEGNDDSFFPLSP